MNNSAANSRRRSVTKSKKADTEKYGAAFFLIAIYYFFEYVRPQDAFIGALAYLKIPMMLSIIMFIYILKSDKFVFKEKMVVLVLLFLAEISISVVFARNSFYVFMAFKGMVLMIAVVLAMPLAIETAKKYMSFVKFWIFINVMLAVHVATHGGRGPGGFTWDENDAALTLVMAIPLAISLMYFKGSEKGRKYVYLLAAVVLVIAVVASKSRGGFLGLASIPFAYWLFSKNKIKNLGKLTLIVVLLSYPVYQLVPDDYKAEVVSISDTEDSTRNTRLEFWGLAWDMFLDNPVIGVGARNYPWNVAFYQMKRKDFDSEGKLLGGREVHSLYFALIAELGLLGTILYVMIIIQIIKKLFFMIRLGEQDPHFYNFGLIAKSFLISLVSFLISGGFISVLYYPPFWYLLGFVLTLNFIVQNELKNKNVSDTNEPDSKIKTIQKNRAYENY